MRVDDFVSVLSGIRWGAQRWRHRAVWQHKRSAGMLGLSWAHFAGGRPCGQAVCLSLSIKSCVFEGCAVFTRLHHDMCTLPRTTEYTSRLTLVIILIVCDAVQKSGRNRRVFVCQVSPTSSIILHLLPRWPSRSTGKTPSWRSTITNDKKKNWRPTPFGVFFATDAPFKIVLPTLFLTL